MKVSEDCGGGVGLYIRHPAKDKTDKQKYSELYHKVIFLTDKVNDIVGEIEKLKNKLDKIKKKNELPINR